MDLSFLPTSTYYLYTSRNKHTFVFIRAPHVQNITGYDVYETLYADRKI